MLSIDPRDPQPPYDQLRRQVIGQIETGELEVGTRLPTVRRLAADLGLAPNTVARTYRELEAQGYVRTLGRNGTVVAPSGRSADQVSTEAGRLAEQYVSGMRQLGLDHDAMINFLRRAIAA